MSVSICEHGQVGCQAEVARSKVEVVLRPAQFPLQDACKSDLSLQEDVSLFLYDTALLVEKHGLEARRGGHPRQLLKSVNEENRNLRENARELKA